HQLRLAINALIVNILAPALILYVMLTSKLQHEMFQIPLSGLFAITVCLLISATLFVVLMLMGYLTRAQAGALILASSFGNGMGIALPAIDALYSGKQTDVPLIYDLLAAVPMVWIGGVLLAAHFGTRVSDGRLGRELLHMPPFWAILISLLLRQTGVEVPDFVLTALHTLGYTAIPLLILLVGMAFRIDRLNYILLTIPVILIKLFISAFAAYHAAHFIGMSGNTMTATVMTAASPAIIVGIALSDRFSLDSELYCTVLTLSTITYVLLASSMPDLIGMYGI
ncbi:MAG: AEC family transporter, partial [Gammaproteobacteria bacterium]